MYPLQVKRRQLNDKSQNFFIQSLLPFGQIIILGQAIDSKNAIFNTTISMVVEQKKYSEQEYKPLIQQKIDNLEKLSIIDSITSLSVICDDILQRKEFQANQFLNQQKIEIINKLKSLKQNLPAISFFSTAVDKAIVSIFQSGIVYSQSELTEQISQQIKSLDGSSDQQNLNQDSTHENLKQKNYDQFQMIDALGNSGLNDTQSVDKILQLTDNIGKNLFKNILPNEDPIQFEGQFVNIHAQQITEKYLCDYFYCGKQLDEIKSEKQSIIYNFKQTEYKDNPYSQDSSFLNYTNQLKKQNSDLKIESYPIIKPTISSYENNPINSFPKQINLNFNVNTDNNKNQTMVCLSKDITDEWTRSGCISMYNKKLKTYSCICDELSPTTIINDLESLFTDSNAGVVFSSDGISNIANFKNFYKYSIFWVLLTLTSLFVFLYKFGALLDNIDIKYKNKHQKFNQQIIKKQSSQMQKKQNKIAPAPVNFNSNLTNIERENEDKQSEIKNIDCSPNLIFSQSVLLKERSEQKIDLNNSNMTKLTLTQSSPSQETVTFNFKQKLSQFSYQMSERMKMINSAKRNNIDINDNNNNQKINANKNTLLANSIIKQDQQETNTLIDSIQDQNTRSSNINTNKIQTDKFSYFKKLSVFRQIIIFHNFFGVFILYNHFHSRQIRFFIFYVRSIHSVSISLFFDKSYSILQQVVIAVINAVLIIIIIKILEKMLSFRGKVMSTISKLIVLTIILGYYYIILSITGGQTVDESNEFILSFGILYFGDILIVSTLIAIVQKIIATFLIKNKEVRGLKKYLYKLLELQLILLSVEMD